MAKIKTGEQITASDLNNLKTAIREMYSHRSLTDTQKGYAGWTLDTNNTQFTQNSSDNLNYIQDLVNACLVINDIPDLLKQTTSNLTDKYIFANGTTTDLLAWVNDRKAAENNTGTHGCRAACLGTCTGGCSKTNTRGALGSGSVEPGTSGYCSDCTGGCQGCSSGCKNNCKSACDSSCRADCATNCSRSCSANNCSGGCSGACSSCSGWCVGVASNYPT